MEELQPAGAPRSLHSQNSIYIRFQNMSSRPVDIIWINFAGEYVKYEKLEARRYIDINTFETHPWIAIDSERKDRMLVDKQFVYMPQNWRDYVRCRYPHIPVDTIPQNVTPPRLLIAITIPLYSLRYRTMLEVRSYLKSDSDVDLLDLPRALSNDLKLLIAERNRFPRSNS